MPHGGSGARRPAVPAGRARTTAARSGGAAQAAAARVAVRRAPAVLPGRAVRRARSSPGVGRPSGGKGRPARTKKQRRRRRLKIGFGVLGGLFVLLGVFIGVVYASTEVPSPDSITNAQTTVVYYSDGTTEMARLGDENRTNVPLDQVSEPAQHAVLAAENRDFYTDPGISATGIARAAWSNLTGGSTQGGSTITQQYVKNAILENYEQSFSRKFQELFVAIKLDNNYSKEQILENYLNTIYYGRGAYGIESAANTYFGVPAAELTAQQARRARRPDPQPRRLRPGRQPRGRAGPLGPACSTRWSGRAGCPPRSGRSRSTRRCCEGRRRRWASRRTPRATSSAGARRAAGQGLQRGPDLRRRPEDHHDGGQALPGRRRDRGERRDDRASRRSCARRSSPSTRRPAPCAPTTAAKTAPDFDYAQGKRQPGSSMKPYVLAAALDQGIGVTARRDGSNNQTFEDREAPVVNSGGASCPAPAP